MKAFAVLTTLVALASANLQPAQDPLFGRAVFGNPPQGRIVGGEEAAPNSIPYQVGLKIMLSDGKQAFCGGSLLSRRHVLTAAHCCEVHAPISSVTPEGNVECKQHNMPPPIGFTLLARGCHTNNIQTTHGKKSSVTSITCLESDTIGVLNLFSAVAAEVILGAHNILDNDEPNRKTFNVPKENIFVHEKWSKFTLLNDICVIKLNEDVEFTAAIQPVTIANKNSGTFEGETTRASGWGKDSDSATTVSPVLREVYTDAMSNSQCNKRYFGLGLIKKTHICANGDGGKSTCNGDSGGPLVVKINNEWILVGLTSFGVSFGCEVGFPAVFTRVSEYDDWIEAKTVL